MTTSEPPRSKGSNKARRSLQFVFDLNIKPAELSAHKNMIIVLQMLNYSHLSGLIVGRL